MRHLSSSSVLLLSTMIPMIWGLFIPESGSDWTLLKPDCDYLPGSFQNLPFEFGIIVTPYVLNNDGNLDRPPISSLKRSMTTRYTTSIVTVTQAPLPTKSIEVYQQQDGQVQRYPHKKSDNYGGYGINQDLRIDPANYIQKRREQNHHGDSDDHTDYPVTGVACKKSSTLSMKLRDSILTDCDGRIGSIVSGRQFQFDGPVPQHGAIYAAGWSVTSNGQLALGNCTKFYQCASGDFYNLYDESIGAQCTPVVLDIVELKDCKS